MIYVAPTSDGGIALGPGDRAPVLLERDQAIELAQHLDRAGDGYMQLGNGCSLFLDRARARRLAMTIRGLLPATP